MKDPLKRTIPSNCQLITWLYTTMMLVSDIIAPIMSSHSAQYMNRAQKSFGSDTIGAKQQLLVDGAVCGDCRTRKTNLYTAWIDYKKAYDSMSPWKLE